MADLDGRDVCIWCHDPLRDGEKRKPWLRDLCDECGPMAALKLQRFSTRMRVFRMPLIELGAIPEQRALARPRCYCVAVYWWTPAAILQGYIDLFGARPEDLQEGRRVEGCFSAQHYMSVN